MPSDLCRDSPSFEHCSIKYLSWLTEQASEHCCRTKLQTLFIHCFSWLNELDHGCTVQGTCNKTILWIFRFGIKVSGCKSVSVHVNLWISHIRSIHSCFARICGSHFTLNYPLTERVCLVSFTSLVVVMQASGTTR